MNDMILILDSTQEYGQEIARRLRAEKICAQAVPAGMTAEEIRAHDARGVILCGAPDAPASALEAAIAALDIPVLAVGQASYALLSALGGANAGVAISGKRRWSPMAGARCLRASATASASLRQRRP